MTARGELRGRGRGGGGGGLCRDRLNPEYSMLDTIKRRQWNLIGRFNCVSLIPAWLMQRSPDFKFRFIPTMRWVDNLIPMKAVTMIRVKCTEIPRLTYSEGIPPIYKRTALKMDEHALLINCISNQVRTFSHANL